MQKNNEFKETGQPSASSDKQSKIDFSLMESSSYRRYRQRIAQEKRQNPNFPDKPLGRQTHQDYKQLRDQKTYQGIFDTSSLILSKGDAWSTPELSLTISEAKKQKAQARETRADRSTYPIEHIHHILPRYRMDNMIYGCHKYPDQIAALAAIFGIEKDEFARMSLKEKAQVACSFVPNLFIGPPDENKRVDYSKSHKVEFLAIKANHTSTDIKDTRVVMFQNIEEIMIEQGEMLKLGLIEKGEKFIPEDFKMICLCLKAVDEFHTELCGKEKLDTNYAFFRETSTGKDTGWALYPQYVDEGILNKHITIGDRDFMKSIIDIGTQHKINTARHFLQLKGDFSDLFVKSVKQRGKWSDVQINVLADAIVNQFTKLQAQYECNNTARSMRRRLQRNNFSGIASKNITDMEDTELVRRYTLAYLERFKEIDPEALADAFIGWDAKYNRWVEDSIVESGGYSSEDADKIVEAIGKKAKSDPEERTKIKDAIKKYTGNEPNYLSEYTRSYVHMFTKMESTGKLYIQAATEFLETGRLPREIPQQEADQLAKTISIRAGILKAIGWRWQQEQIKQREEAIKRSTGKTLGDFIQNALQERVLLSTNITATDITYGKAASQFFENMELPSFISSQKVADQLANAIRIMADILETGTDSEQAQVSKTKKTITDAKIRPGDYVRSILQGNLELSQTTLLGTKIEGMDITYAEAASQFFEKRELPLDIRSQDVIDQLISAIGIKIATPRGAVERTKIKEEIVPPGEELRGFIESVLKKRLVPGEPTLLGTEIEGMDTTYGKVASQFFETGGTLPREVPSQEVAKQLAKTIEIVADILKGGTLPERAQVSKIEEKKIVPPGKTLRDFVQNALQKCIKIAGTQVTYEQVFSELCEHSQILPKTRSMLLPDGKPLSQSQTDQIKEAIRLQVQYYNKRVELRQAFFSHTRQSKELSEHVEDCLKELRSWW